jgi:hypothetical protein
VKQGAQVSSDVFYNQLTSGGTITGVHTTPLALPVDIGLPTLEQAVPGTQDVTVGVNQSITLSAGAYRDVLVKRNGTIRFAGGGVFSLRNLNTRDNATILFDAPSTIIIQQKLDTDQDSYVGPQAGSGVGAKDIVFHVAGINGGNGQFDATPKAVQFGLRNTVAANAYSPNGTLWLRQGTVATGAFIARDVIVGEQVEVTLESAFEAGSSALPMGEGSMENEESSALAARPEVLLLQNQPNPFSSRTQVTFTLNEPGEATLRIYSVTGQFVRLLGPGRYGLGRHQIAWDGRTDSGRHVPPGVYLYQLALRDQHGREIQSRTRRMTLLK